MTIRRTINQSDATVALAFCETCPHGVHLALEHNGYGANATDITRPQAQRIGDAAREHNNDEPDHTTYEMYFTADPPTVLNLLSEWPCAECAVEIAPGEMQNLDVPPRKPHKPNRRELRKSASWFG